MKIVNLWTAARDALDVIECLRMAFPDTVGRLPLADTTDALRRELALKLRWDCHVLHQEASLCELRAPPSTWPPGERSVPLEERGKATCPECLEEAAGLERLGLI